MAEEQEKKGAADEATEKAQQAVEKVGTEATRWGLRALTGGASAALGPLEGVISKAGGKIISYIVLGIVGIIIFFVLMVSSLFSVVLSELGFGSAGEYAEASYAAQQSGIIGALEDYFETGEYAADHREWADGMMMGYSVGYAYDEIFEDYYGVTVNADKEKDVRAVCEEVAETYDIDVSYTEYKNEKKTIAYHVDAPGSDWGYSVTSDYDSFWTDDGYLDFFVPLIQELGTTSQIHEISNGNASAIPTFLQTVFTSDASQGFASWILMTDEEEDGGESRVYYKYIATSTSRLTQGQKYYADDIESKALDPTLISEIEQSFNAHPEYWEVGTETANGDIYDANLYESIKNLRSGALWDEMWKYVHGGSSISGAYSPNTESTESDKDVYYINLVDYSQGTLETSGEAQYETVNDEESLQRAEDLLEFVTGESEDSEGAIFGIFDNMGESAFMDNHPRIQKVWKSITGWLERQKTRVVALGKLTRDEIRSLIGDREMRQLQEFVSWETITYMDSEGNSYLYGDTSLGARAAQCALEKKDWSYDQNRRMRDGYVDCSSLCARSYNEAGWDALMVGGSAKSAAEIMRYCDDEGISINNPSELMPGDLCFFTKGPSDRYKNVSHVCMYIGDYKGDGNNYVISAEGKKYGVVIKEFNSYIARKTVVGYGRPYVSSVASDLETTSDIYDYLISVGFTKAGACGVLGNIQVESGFNPNATSASGTYYGLCQWGNGRRKNLESYCKSNGLDYTSVDGQVNFMVYEMQNDYKKVYNYLTDPAKATDPQQCAQEFCVGIEGCVGSTGSSGDATYSGTLYPARKGKTYQLLGTRMKSAQSFFDQF